jgi:hypothetical protein
MDYLAADLARQGTELLSHLPDDDLAENVKFKTNEAGALMVSSKNATYTLRHGIAWRYRAVDRRRGSGR